MQEMWLIHGVIESNTYGEVLVFGSHCFERQSREGGAGLS